MADLTPNARAFLEANKCSPVVSGSAIANGGEGGHYILKNGKSFTLTRGECAAVGHPKWLGA